MYSVSIVANGANFKVYNPVIVQTSTFSAHIVADDVPTCPALEQFFYLVTKNTHTESVDLQPEYEAP